MKMKIPLDSRLNFSYINLFHFKTYLEGESLCLNVYNYSDEGRPSDDLS